MTQIAECTNKVSVKLHSAQTIHHVHIVCRQIRGTLCVLYVRMLDAPSTLLWVDFDKLEMCGGGLKFVVHPSLQL